MKTFDPKSTYVLSEILGIGFRAYPRNLINGVVFGSLAAWFLRDILPHPFLASWMAGLFALNTMRYAMAFWAPR